jgi:hypothetical protein
MGNAPHFRKIRGQSGVDQHQSIMADRMAVISSAKIEHEAQKVEVVALKTELNGLEERLNALKERLVSLPGPKAEEARSVKPARDLNAGRDSSNQRIGATRDGSDFSTGSQVAEPSIHASMPHRKGSLCWCSIAALLAVRLSHQPGLKIISAFRLGSPALP